MSKPSVIQNRRIVPVGKAASYAGVSRWSIYTWIEEGRLPIIRYPGKNGGSFHKMIDLDDLDRFIAEAKKK